MTDREAAKPLLDDGSPDWKRLAEIELVAKTMSRTLSRFTDFDDLHSFVESVLQEVLAAVGSECGGMVLISEREGKRFADHVAIVEIGAIVDVRTKVMHAMSEVPFDDAMDAFVTTLERDGSAAHGPEHPVCRPAFRDYLNTLKIVEVYPVPVRAGGRMIGWLGAAYTRRLAPHEDPTNRLAALADPMAIAVEFFKAGVRAKDAAIVRSRIEAAENRARALERFNDDLSRATAAFVTNQDLDELLAITLQAMCLRLGGPNASGAVWLVALHGGRPTCRLEFVRGRIRPLSPHALSRTVSDELPVEVLAANTAWGTPFLVPIASMPAGRRRRLRDRRCSRSVFVPMIFPGESQGYFVIDIPAEVSEISDETLQLAQILGYQATISIHLHRLSERSRRAAHGEATLAERARITRDLGDSLAQGLTGILRHLQASQRTTDPALVRVHARDALDAARSTLLESRRSIRMLRTEPIDRVDLATALRGLLKATLGGTGIAIEVDSEHNVWIDQAAETELIMIAQEAAAAVSRRAGVSRFLVRLRCEDQTLEMTIEDDGQDLVETRDENDELAKIRTRCGRLGADLGIDRLNGRGTRLLVRMNRDEASEPV